MNAVFNPSFPQVVYTRLFRAIAKISLSLHWIRLRATTALKIVESVSLEADLLEVKRVIKEAWTLFLDLAERLQQTGAWRLKARTWDSYCRKYLGVNPSRISQLRGAFPYASAILDAGLGNAPEGHIRLLRKTVPLESPKMLEAWQLGNLVAQAERRAPTEALYNHAHEILLEAENTNGIIQIDAGVYHIGDTSQAIRAVQARIKEVQRIAQEGQAHRLIEVTAILGEDGRWEFILSQELPKSMKVVKFNIYK